MFNSDESFQVWENVPVEREFIEREPIRKTSRSAASSQSQQAGAALIGPLPVGQRNA